MSTWTLTTTFEAISCFKCAAIFAVHGETKVEWIDRHRTFWCPACGQQQAYTAKSDAEKAREERDRAREQLARAQTYSETLRDQRDHERRRVASYQGVVTRTKRRIASGVCPCCTRSFANLKRHMAGQHPDYGREQEVPK